MEKIKSVKFLKIKSIKEVSVEPSYDFTVADEHRIIARNVGTCNGFYTSNCWHPDIYEFITAKQTEGRLTKFNMSVLITDEFMHCVKNNLPWNLEFPDMHADKDVYKKEWDGNLTKWKHKGYPTVIYKTYDNANELWDVITSSTYNRNEPGVLFVDTINRLNNLKYIEYISATNPCVAKGTLVDTPEGGVPVENIKVGDYVLTINGVESVTDIETHKDYPVLQVMFSDGVEQIVTPSHQYKLFGGDGFKRVYELNENDQIEMVDVVYDTKTKKYKVGQSRSVTIESILPYDNADVYDIYCEESDTWITSGRVNRGCGEQILPVGGACLLGSLNLTQFIDYENNDWDYVALKKVIPTVNRFMDNINDLTYVPLENQKEELKNKRRIGLGVLGYGSALMMLKLRYGSPEALEMTERLMQFIANTAYQSSALLAKEKGCFPLYNEELYLQSDFLKVLSDETIDLIKQYGVRNSHLLSIQPTGNSSILANNVSGGLEPVFLPQYIRTSITPYPPSGLYIPQNIDWTSQTYNTETLWEWVKEGDTSLLRCEYEGFVYKFDKSRGLLKETLVEDYAVKFLKEKGEWDADADWVATTSNLTVSEHIDTMKVFSKYICSAISKTINLPNDYPFEDFKGVYMECYNSGTIKGCTTYRAGTMTSVLADANKQKQKEKVKIIKNSAPKRPSILPCDIHQLTVNGEKWLVLVSLLDKDPYEIFAFKKKLIKIPDAWKTGELHKMRSNVYKLVIGDFEIEDIGSQFERAEEELITMITSGALRHGMDIKFIHKIFMKAEGSVVSFSKAIARILKKYLEPVSVGLYCESCGDPEGLIVQENCYKCKSCGISKCE